MTAGLLLILRIYIRALADCLTECYFWLLKRHLYLVFRQKLACDDIQMLVAHTIKKCLPVLTVIDNLQSQVFLCHLCKSLSDLILLAFYFCTVSLVCIRCGNLDLSVCDRVCLCGERIAGRCIEFADRTDITCVQLFYFDRTAAFQNVKLADAVLGILRFIVQHIIALDYTGCNLDQGVLTDERIHDRLKDKRRFCFCKVVICLENFLRLHIDASDLSGLRRRHIAYDIIKQDYDTLKT